MYLVIIISDQLYMDPNSFILMEVISLLTPKLLCTTLGPLYLNFLPRHGIHGSCQQGMLIWSVV